MVALAGRRCSYLAAQVSRFVCHEPNCHPTEDADVKLVQPISAFGRSDVSLVGGKAASLGELVHAGFSVPTGVVVLSSAYRQFLQKAHLDTRVTEAIVSDDRYTEDNEQDRPYNVEEILSSTEMPPPIEGEIRNIFSQYGLSSDDLLAVRSSATVEDAKNHSWAGLFSTHLNVRATQVPEKVKSCWISLFHRRALYYARINGISISDISVAVIIQKMVQPEKAGTVFSADPTAISQQQVAIEASPGLGDTLVSGSITPDLYIVEKASGSILRRSLSGNRYGAPLHHKFSDRPMQLAASRAEAIPRNVPVTPVLNNSEIALLFKAVIEIENIFGFPCDVEWAISRGVLNILQCRPLTAIR